MRVLVVDDEPHARARLLRMLSRIDGVEPVGEASNGREALERIRALSPDCVLLDIHLPGLDGLEVARAAPGVPIVFTTAHDRYAVEAFELSAVDYLLKPVRADRLERALARTREGHVDSERLHALLDRLLAGRADDAAPPRITARRGNTLRVFDPRHVARFSAAGGYTSFRCEGEEFLLEQSLSALEETLAPHGFVRVHRKELVRLDAVRALRAGEGGTAVELADGQRAPVSRRLVGELKRRLGID